MLELTVQEHVKSLGGPDARLDIHHKTINGPYGLKYFHVHAAEEFDLERARERLKEALIRYIEKTYSCTIAAVDWDVDFVPSQRALRGKSSNEGSTATVASAPEGVTA